MKRFTIEQQGNLSYVISPFNEPTITVNTGETITVETEDCWYGATRPEKKRRKYEEKPGMPLTGPISVEGAEKGDVLMVNIKDIKPASGQGATRIYGRWWWYIGSGTETLRQFLDIPMREIRFCPIKDGKVYFKENIILPYRPHIGTIATAPEAEAVKARPPDTNGGNMDLITICPGNKLYLPVYTKGALLYLGDAHGLQGEGEISGSAVEMAAEVTLTLDLIKGKAIPWPRIESPDFIMCVAASGAGRTLEDAIRIAFLNIVLWLEKECGFNRWDAWQLCTMLGEISVGNIWTVAAKFPKKYIK